MYKVIIVSLLLLELKANAQVYTTSNAHSHNDYEQSSPFWNAWMKEFGSIEADIFLVNGQLIVAHDSTQLWRKRTLDSLYLQPLAHCMDRRIGRGYVYADTTKQIQLMIDIKSEAVATLKKLVENLSAYPLLIQSRGLKIVISGNRPPAAEFSLWPSYIYFDGDLGGKYTKKELSRIRMLSANFAKFTSWNGFGNIPIDEEASIKAVIDSAHRAGKKVRFWNTPDIPYGWKQLIKWRVDYINTDRIERLSYYLEDKGYRD